MCDDHLDAEGWYPFVKKEDIGFKTITSETFHCYLIKFQLCKAEPCVSLACMVEIKRFKSAITRARDLEFRQPSLQSIQTFLEHSRNEILDLGNVVNYRKIVIGPLDLGFARAIFVHLPLMPGFPKNCPSSPEETAHMPNQTSKRHLGRGRNLTPGPGRQA
jgi:hypothetical protein